MTPATATQNLNSKLRPASPNGPGRGSGPAFGPAPIRSNSPPVRIVRAPGYRGGGYRIDA